MNNAQVSEALGEALVHLRAINAALNALFPSGGSEGAPAEAVMLARQWQHRADDCGRLARALVEGGDLADHS